MELFALFYTLLESFVSYFFKFDFSNKINLFLE